MRFFSIVTSRGWVGAAALVLVAGACSIDDPRFREPTSSTAMPATSVVDEAGDDDAVGDDAVGDDAQALDDDSGGPTAFERTWDLPVGLPTETAVAVADGHLVVMQLDGTGDAVVSNAFAGEGVTATDPQLAADGRSVFVEVWHDDAAFSCDRVHGEVMQVDLAQPGEPVLIGAGRSPAPSPDGRWLAHISGSTCLETDDFLWEAPSDNLVITDLVRGTQRSLRLPVPASPDAVGLVDVAWDWAGAIVFVVGQQIFRVFPDETSIDLGAALLAVGNSNTERLSIAGVGPDGVLTYGIHEVVDGRPVVSVLQMNLASQLLVADLGVFDEPVSVALDITGAEVLIADPAAVHHDELRVVADRQAEGAGRGTIGGADF